MKFLLSLFLLMFPVWEISAQKYFDAGVLGGVSYYLGEINPSRQFYDVSPAYGVFFRYNINNREAFRLTLTHMGLRANDADFQNAYQQLRNASFHASFTEISSTFEFHFLPYVTNKKNSGFSPYLFVGMGYLTFINSTYNKGNNFSVPFGMGVKYTISKTIGTGFEWGMRKYFDDTIDGITNPGGKEMKPFINNNDWYSFAGFFISFRLHDNSGDCPVYW
jgi:hypothetical protein